MSKYEKRTPNQLGPLLFPFSLPFSHAQCSQLVLESSAWFSFRVCMVQLPFLHAKLCSPIKFHFPFIAHKKKSLYTGRICTSVRVYEKTTPIIYIRPKQLRNQTKIIFMRIICVHADGSKLSL